MLEHFCPGTSALDRMWIFKIIRSNAERPVLSLQVVGNEGYFLGARKNLRIESWSKLSIIFYVICGVAEKREKDR